MLIWKSMLKMPNVFTTAVDMCSGTDDAYEMVSGSKSS